MPGPAYREYALAPPLDGLVECVWVLSQQAGPANSSAVQRIPPDGSVEVIFHLRDPFAQVEDRRTIRQPPALVVGVWTGPIALVAPEGFDTLGIRIKPGAALAFWAEPLASFTDTVVDATAVWGSGAAELRERLGATVDDAKRLQCIQAFLLTRLRRPARALAGPIQRIVATRGRASIDALARDAGVSHRQLERAFRAHVGVTPKMLSRIVRFQNVLRFANRGDSGAATRPAAAWADVAIGCGYADQSHLIRDFTQFTGDTPATLAAAEPELADYFRRR